MIIRIVAFTLRGGMLAGRLEKMIAADGHDVRAYCFEKYALDACLPPVSNLKLWCGENWDIADAIVFVSAAGIAVRSIAPYIKSKKTDPSVTVIDEAGQFSISILSGHIGGGNEFAQYAAEKIGATPVITTATDVNNKVAIDVIATKNNLYIASMKMAKEVSAAILAGEKIGFFSIMPVDGELPEYFTLNKPQKINVEIGFKAEYNNSLLLIPKTLSLGLGCKRGTPQQDIEDAFEIFIKENDIPRECIVSAASIDLKKDEEGLLGFCENHGLAPVIFYTADELNSLQGDYSESAFVKQTTGVGCVCERSSVLRSGGGKLIVRKTKFSGITMALASEEMRIKI